jgi:Arc/MetJ-type ribon-helix-helix transcriptional regulator
MAHSACRSSQARSSTLSASDVIRYALTSVQERLSEAELREAVIKHVHNEAKLYPGRARRGLPPDSSSDAAKS